ncbi:hypothetical protein ACO0LD_17795 [Undibacterium sp. Ji83W]|uniref:hypothetical protein n=1 Tax=Undibacterium sp. Ji83W TaxID=3413043 RepID=UPI003BF30CC5
MSIIILNLGKEQGDCCHARVRHDDHEFDALVFGSRTSLQPLLNKSRCTEMSFERVLSWRELEDFSNEQSSIHAAPGIDAAIVLKGKVISIIPVDSDTQIIDIYLRAGPEFLALSSDEIDGKFAAIGKGVEVIVSGLCFYPSNL